MSEKSSDLVSNRRAFHDYEIMDTMEAGIVLQGTEIKSLRANGGSLQEAYVRVFDHEVWLIGCTIAPYRYGNVHNHEDKRERKLLLHKREIALLKSSSQEKGLSIIPIAMYFKNGRIKLRIALAKGKKLHDKRHAIRERDEKKRMDQTLKNYGV